MAQYLPGNFAATKTVVATLFGSQFQVVWFAVSVAVYGCFSVSDSFLSLRLVSSVVLRLASAVALVGDLGRGTVSLHLFHLRTC
jgi:hypothetical protein